MKNLLIFTILSIVLFLGCSKKGYDPNTNYKYPFNVSLQSATNDVAGKDIPVLITINETGEHKNPETEYTLKFNSSSQGYLKSQTGQIYDSSHEIKVNNTGAINFYYVASTSGQHTVTFTLANKQGSISESKVTYSIADASFQIFANPSTIEVEQGQIVNINFGITENTNFTSPYQVSILNMDDAESVKLNGTIISKTSNVTISNKMSNTLEFVYKKAGDFTPTISVKNGSVNMSYPISIKVKSKQIIINSFDFVKNTTGNSGQNISIKNTGRLMQTTPNNQIKTYLNPRLSHNISTAKASVKISASNNSIDYILSEGQKYYSGDWFNVTTSEINNIQIFSKFSNYGKEAFTFDVKDEYSNISEPKKIDFLYYNIPSWTNILPLYSFWQGEVKTLNGPFNTKYYTLERIKNISAVKFSGNGAKIKSVQYEMNFGSNSGFAVTKKGVLNYDSEEVLFSETWDNINNTNDRWNNHRSKGIIMIEFEVKNEFGDVSYMNEVTENSDQIFKFL